MRSSTLRLLPLVLAACQPTDLTMEFDVFGPIDPSDGSNPLNPENDLVEGRFVVKLAPGRRELLRVHLNGHIVTGDTSLDKRLHNVVRGQPRHLMEEAWTPVDRSDGQARTIVFESDLDKETVLAELASHPGIEWVEPVV